MSTKEKVVIIGGGWGGYRLGYGIDHRKFDITLISPENTSAVTPLLASAACGLFDPRLAHEPIRRKDFHAKYIKAFVVDIDFNRQALICQPAFEELKDERFEVFYDRVIVSPGCQSNTFGIPGVAENAIFVKNVANANTDKTSVSVLDVAPQILAPFDQKLSEYACSALKTNKVNVKLGCHILKVTPDTIESKESGVTGYGMLIWATGNRSIPLIDQLQLRKTERGLTRILTDDHLNVFSPDGSVIPNVFAMGDAADIEGGTLPTTAEVAIQKADYLISLFNSGDKRPFQYKQRSLVTYTGAWDGVIQGQREYTGYGAWLSWRSGNFFWTRSWRRRILMGYAWFMDWLDGREIIRN